MPHNSGRAAAATQAGFSLVELMVSIVIGLVILAAMVALFVNSSGANRELARANSLVENGRLAIELLESDVVHAGFWGSYMPNFDDQTFADVPPTDASDGRAGSLPGLRHAVDRRSTGSTCIHVPVNVYDSDAFCARHRVETSRPTRDVLVVRHAELCEAGSGGNCEDDVDGNVYFQSSRCPDDPERFRFGIAADTDVRPAADRLRRRRPKSASSSRISTTSATTQ